MGIFSLRGNGNAYFDYARLGKLGFLVSYGTEANEGFIKTKSLDSAYSKIAFEIRANVAEALVASFLKGNTDIRDKVAKGTPLTKEELHRVQEYALSQVSNGTLREGLQYIEGQLVFVRLIVK